MIKTEKFVLGDYMVNCYLITDAATGAQAIIDPGYQSIEVFEAITKGHTNNLKYILLTHGHFDHIGFVQKIKAITRAKIVIGKNDEEFLQNKKLNLSMLTLPTPLPPQKADITLCDGDTLDLGESKIKFIETPGHTKGGGCYIVDDNLFCGDTLMKGSMGRTDLPTGNDKEMSLSMKKLNQLELDYNVYPGHGDSSTLNEERKHNPYLGGF